MRSSKATELAHEQAHVTMLYERLDALRAATAQRLAAVRLDPTAENNQAWSERDSLAGLYQVNPRSAQAAPCRRARSKRNGRRLSRVPDAFAKEHEMPEYEESGSANASPEVVFAFLSDVDHLTDYIPDMVLARPEGELLQVAAEVQGRYEEGTGWFRADPDQRRIDWGREGTTGYGGWLKVTASPPGSLVTIHLSTVRTSDEAEIRASLSQALRNITDQVKGP